MLENLRFVLLLGTFYYYRVFDLQISGVGLLQSNYSSDFFQLIEPRRSAVTGLLHLKRSWLANDVNVKAAITDDAFENILWIAHPTRSKHYPHSTNLWQCLEISPFKLTWQGLLQLHLDKVWQNYFPLVAAQTSLWCIVDTAYLLIARFLWLDVHILGTLFVNALNDYGFVNLKILYVIRLCNSG